MIVGFDADDTLWVNEKHYHEIEKKVKDLVAPYCEGIDLSKEMYKTEISNLELFGYGAKGFILSLIETVLRVTEGEIPGKLVEKIILLGKDLIDMPVVLIGNVQSTLAVLKENGHELILLTKGDLRDQHRKLEKSGLGEYFAHAEVMKGKTEKDYRQVFKKLEISPVSFVMIGDSVRSDVLPVLAAGGWAVQVQGGTTWAHETFDGEISSERFFRIGEIGEAAAVVEKISKKSEMDVFGSGEDKSGVRIHTDGGCLGNPGPGGWAFIVSAESGRVHRSGSDRNTTNNRMELTAVIEALKYVLEKDPDPKSKITLFTDSRYVRDGITRWIHNWEKNGWKTSAGKPVKNRELWMELRNLSGRMHVQWEWIRGHSGDPLNEECDALVKGEMSRITGNS